MNQPSAEFLARLPQSHSDIYDVAIVGGGMVGSSLALALSSLPLKVALIEPHLQTSPKALGFDARAIALSWSSCRIFNGLGLWKQLKNIATPIQKIHVSDKGNPGICRLDAKQLNVAAMGQVVELEDVAAIIQNAISESTTDLIQASVSAIETQEDASLLSLDFLQSNQQDNQQNTLNKQKQPQTLRARLVVAADGKSSVIRSLSGIKSSDKAYDQVAMISTIQTQLPHNNVAFERFTERGPVAFLPLSNNRISLVWMMQAEEASSIIKTSDEQFIAQLQNSFGQRLGKITRVGERSSYPLSLLTAKQCIGNRLVLVGNAAQSLHPIAGQGFNLGLRDVAALSDMLRKACKETRDPGSQMLLDEYQNWRQNDRDKVVDFTDLIARLFANSSHLVSVPRNTILMAMNWIPELRAQVATAAMGLTGKQSRLVRGLSLKLESN